MINNCTCLSYYVGDKLFQVFCRQDSTTVDLKEVASQMIAEVVDVEKRIAEQQAQAEEEKTGRRVMAYTNRITWEPLRSISSASLTGGYDALGTPLAHPGYIVKMVSTSTTTVTVSIDGVGDIDVCPAGSFWLYDEGKVGQSSSSPELPAGTQIYVKGTAGSGTIYLVVQYIIVS